jgi:hypothetical protein
MKRNMKVNRTNQKMKRVIVNVPTKMNMKKSIEANTKQNRIEVGHEDENEHESEYEHESESEDEHEFEGEHECEQCRCLLQCLDAPKGTS